MEAANNSITVVLEVGMHCESCASDTIHCARSLKGVETVTVDIDSNKLTVVGEVDPLQIQEDLHRKIKKKVVLISPHHSKKESDNNKDERESNEERLGFNKVSPDQPKVEDPATGSDYYDNNSNEKNPVTVTDEALLTTLVVKLGHYCQGCSSNICKIVMDTNGVQAMAVDEQKETVTVTGIMDTKLLIENLKERLNRPIGIVSLVKEDSTAKGKYSENASDDSKNKNVSGQDNGNDDTEKEWSMDLKPLKSPVTMAVYKVPLHCDGCTRRIRKIIRRIRGVDEVRINKEEESVKVIGTIDVETLTETMKERLKKLVEEHKIEMRKEAEVIKDASQYSFDKKAPKQECNPQSALELTEQPSEIIQIISFHQLNGETQTSVNSGDAHKKESSSSSETTEWGFLITSLILEGVSAVLDQLGYLLTSMVLSFAALLLSIVELVDMARREGLIKFDRRSDLPCFSCHSTDKSPTSELFSVVHCFGFTCAVWQCLFSTVQYIYALRKLDNPIRMTLLPFIFLFCVLISKLTRKMEEINCEIKARAKIEPEVYHSQSPNAYVSPVEPSSSDQGCGLRRTEQNGQTSESMETKPQVQTDASEPLGTTVSLMEFTCGDFGCSHYWRRCKIRAPCCNEIFDCSDCHNEFKNTWKISPHDRHHIPFQEVLMVICSLCETEQVVQQNCISCGVCMGKYFCAKCKFFDDDVSKNQYHCDECGICRNGGRENFFHCKKCGSCYPKLTEDAHHCME